MPMAPSNGIEICYDEFGSRDDPAVLLIRGFGSQMISWHEGFCTKLASGSLRVVRFDNRDVGLSTKPSAPYSLSDMAADGVDLLDHLGIEKAHVAGMSMGGMIAQLMAIEHPSRVLSLVSIMSSMGGDDAVPPTPEAAAIFAKPPAASREEAASNAVADRRVIGSPAPWFDEADIRHVAGASYDRCHYPEGRVRQMLAIRAAPSRRDALAKLTIPVTVVHGTVDPLVPFENGRRTADAIAQAELVAVDGMGHDIPAGAWDTVIAAIAATVRRASE